jgi:hypothetical protein
MFMHSEQIIPEYHIRVNSFKIVEKLLPTRASH